MPEQLPLQPDAIRPAKGEPVVTSKYPRVRYVCLCPGDKKHVALRYFDEEPPQKCQKGFSVVQDLKWVDPNFRPEPYVHQPSPKVFNNWDGYPKIGSSE